MQQTIEALIDLAKDSLDLISWALCEQLDKLAAVRVIDPHAWIVSLNI
jgi:hypothetical protein